MKLTVRQDGYIRVGLTKDDKQSYHLVHRLVASAFQNKDNDSDIVDHIDRNRSNNNYQNLRWTNASGNNRNKSIAINNASGTSGVSYDKKGYWYASWHDENMKKQHKCFSVNTYGDGLAKQKAITHRKQMEEEHGYLNEWDSIKLKYVY